MTAPKDKNDSINKNSGRHIFPNRFILPCGSFQKKFLKIEKSPSPMIGDGPLAYEARTLPQGQLGKCNWRVLKFVLNIVCPIIWNLTVGSEFCQFGKKKKYRRYWKISRCLVIWKKTFGNEMMELCLWKLAISSHNIIREQMYYNKGVQEVVTSINFVKIKTKFLQNSLDSNSYSLMLWQPS